jgi:hypothetical protein
MAGLDMSADREAIARIIFENVEGPMYASTDPDALHIADQILALPRSGEQTVSVPEGWVLVPLIQTRAMRNAIPTKHFRGEAVEMEMWARALSASPPRPAKTEGQAAAQVEAADQGAGR